MASVSLEFSAYLDPRFGLLGKISGFSKFDAIGRMGIVWTYCIEKTMAVLPDELIDMLVEIDGYSDLIVQVQLGERVNETEVRIRGTRGRIEWLAEARERQKVATEAAKKKRKEKSPKSDPISEPKSDPTVVTSSSSAPASSSAPKDLIHIVQRKRRTESVASNFDLQKAYDMYPKKQGKSKGLARLSKEIQTQEDYAALLQAIERYKQSPDVQRGFVKLFSTFAAEFRDWSESDAGTVKVASSDNSTPLHQVRPV